MFQAVRINRYNKLCNYWYIQHIQQRVLRCDCLARAVAGCLDVIITCIAAADGRIIQPNVTSSGPFPRLALNGMLLGNCT